MPWHEDKRKTFDDAVAELQASKSKVDAIVAGLSNRNPPWVMDRLNEARAQYVQARQEFDKVCTEIENFEEPIRRRL